LNGKQTAEDTVNKKDEEVTFFIGITTYEPYSYTLTLINFSFPKWLTSPSHA